MSAVSPVVSRRKEGSDNLGTSLGVTAVNFDTGSYDNKHLIAGITTIAPTFTATRKGYYGFTVIQDASGDRIMVWPSNVKFSGTPPQPAVGNGVQSHWLMYFDGTNFYVN